MEDSLCRPRSHEGLTQASTEACARPMKTSPSPAGQMELPTAATTAAEPDLRVDAKAYAEAVDVWCDAARDPHLLTPDNVRLMLGSPPQLTFFFKDLKDSSAARTCLEPLLGFQVVPRTVALLRGIHALHQHTVAHAYADGDAPGYWALLAANCLLNSLMLLNACVRVAWCSAIAAGPAGAAAAAAGAAQHPRNHRKRWQQPRKQHWPRLLEQLTAEETVRELSRVPGFVQQHLWPLSGAVSAGAASGAASAGGGGGNAGAGAAQHAPSAAQRMPLSAYRSGILHVKSAAFSGIDGATVGSRILTSVAYYISHNTAVSESFGTTGAAESDAGSESGSEPPTALTQIQGVIQRFLATLAEAGLLASLSAALLAAPPWPEVPPGAEELQDYTMAIVQAQLETVEAVHGIFKADSSRKFKPLLAPEVRRLQRELLEQVAATAEDTTAAATARCGGGSNVGGSGASGGAAPRRQRWPLLQRHVLRLAFGPSMQINEVMYECVSAAVPLFPVHHDLAGAMSFLEGMFSSRTAAVALGARVCAALHARLASMGVAGAQPRPGAKVPPQHLVRAVDGFAFVLRLRLGDATPEEQVACMPDLLAIVGWVAAAWATPAGLFMALPANLVASVNILTGILQGTVFSHPLHTTRGSVVVWPRMPPFFWRNLSPGVQSACLRRLLPTDLPRSLDRLVRHVAAAAKDQSMLQPATMIRMSLAELIGPLLRARLVQWRVQQRLEQQQQQQQQRPGGSSGGALHGASGGSSPAAGSWRAEEELGLVLTTLKLLRLQAAVKGSQGSVPELLTASDAPTFSLVLFVVGIGCTLWGLPTLLVELTKAAGGGGGDGAAAGEESGARPEDVAMVAQAVAACGVEGMRCLARMCEQAAETAATATGGLNDKDVEVCLSNMVSAADAVLGAAAHLPPEALLEAQPQRVLAAVGRVVGILRRQQQWQRGSAELAGELYSGMANRTAKAVLLLSADERLLAECVPGWLWVEPRRGAAHREGITFDEAALASVRGPSYVPQKGPVLTMAVDGKTMVRFGSRRWEDNGITGIMGELAALARARAQEPGEMGLRAWELAAAVVGGGEAALWPPRRLRLCANPGCGNFSGGSEAGLDLKKCSGCRAVRYCGAACQRQHWSAHKAECARWRAGASAAAAGAGADEE